MQQWPGEHSWGRRRRAQQGELDSPWTTPYTSKFVDFRGMGPAQCIRAGGQQWASHSSEQKSAQATALVAPLLRWAATAPPALRGCEKCHRCCEWWPGCCRNQAGSAAARWTVRGGTRSVGLHELGQACGYSGCYTPGARRRP